MRWAVLVAALVELQGPDGQRIWAAPAQIVNIREPRATAHFAPGTQCLLYTTDGKIITVAEPCDAVRKKLQ